MNRISIGLAALFFAAACVPFEPLEGEPGYVAAAPTGGPVEPRVSDLQQTTLAKYFAAYKAKDVDAIVATYDDNILGALHPDTVFGRGIDAARPGVEGDFAMRPESYVAVYNKLRIADDKWITVGESVNGAERAPMWIVFDFNAAGDKIEATYAQIGTRSFISGASVDEPTPVMANSYIAMRTALDGKKFDGAAKYMADNVALYKFPPADIEDYGPVITGPSDVASVLAFKWGEGAWDQDNTTYMYMQFALALIPGAESGGLDRVALFTFDADPASPSYEKVIRVDVMGPSGG